ncbi:MAG TPA: hypothetical protein VMW95_04550 [Desulfobacterales bacterium]|nr:hypothetical protein [Desulfobacterales bacterium]
MKFLSLRILILCILLPPVLYIFSVQSIERHLKGRYANEIEDFYLEDTRPLFEGSIRLKDAINNNINRYIQSKALIALGVKVAISVTSKQNTILYPAVVDAKEASLLPNDAMEIASDNYKLMNEGLVVNVDLVLEHNSLLTNAILGFFIFASILVLSFYYWTGVKKAGQEEMEKNSELFRLKEVEINHADNLKALMKDKKNLISEIKKIKKQLKKETIKASKNEDEMIKASKNEDEMIKEIVALEEKVHNKINFLNERQEEIDALKEKIKLFEKEARKESKQKTKVYNSVRKRLKTLYKNISIDKRAIIGFLDLTEDMKIKSEEIIHKLNENPKLVPIKRKVFSKKGRSTVQEVIFAYNGRLYFRATKNSRIEILTIGTKNTQAKDLEYLDSI